jgi:hypothetical protein
LNKAISKRLGGDALTSAGLACFDANGDGIDDLLWTNQDSTEIRRNVWVHFGDVNFSTIPSMKLQNPGSVNFGNVIADAGDMNGDGHSDVAVGVFSVTEVDGLVLIYGGGPDIDSNFDAGVGMDFDSNFGWSMSGLGDVTGDGLGDIIVGAPDYAFGEQKGYWGIFKGDSSITVTSVRENLLLPSLFTLYQAYPNPFNPTTTIEYDVKQRSFVTLRVYNTLGQEIRILINKEQDAGQHSIQFDGKGLSSGSYFYEIIIEGPDGTTTRQTKKMLLLSEREKQAEDEYERHLLTIGLAGDDAALKELARLQFKRADGRFKQFLMDPDNAIPDSLNRQRSIHLGFAR